MPEASWENRADISAHWRALLVLDNLVAKKAIKLLPFWKRVAHTNTFGLNSPAFFWLLSFL